MKLHISFLRQAVLFGAALLAISCSLEFEPQPHSFAENAPIASRTIHFQANLRQTKAQFGERDNDSYPTLWTDNDQAVKLSLNYGGAQEAEVNPTWDYRSATFDAQISFAGVSGPYTFYSVSPASAAQSLSPSREAWKVTIPCVQTPTDGSVDEAGIILAATSASYQTVQQAEDVDLFFNHLTAYGRMTLANLTLADGESVQSVELTITTPFVGDWFWKTDGTNLIDYGASSTLTINTSRTSDIWFACAPVDVSGELLKITVYTTAGYYERYLEFPASSVFEAGHSAVFSVDMDQSRDDVDYVEYAGGSTPSGDFTLVTDAATLAAGDEIIIANIDATYGLGPANSSGSTPYRQAVAITAVNEVLSSIGTATVLTLREGSESGCWALDTGDGYLATTSTKNSLSTSSGITGASSWTISIIGGEAAIVAKSGSYNSIRYNYNQGNPRFSGYGSSSSVAKPAIYRRGIGSGGSSSNDPMLSETEFGCYLGTGYERTLAAGTDQVTRAYSSSGVLTYTIIDASTVEELEISGYSRGLVKGDNVSLTVNWRRGNTTVLSQSYTMKVVREEGPKVWISNGNGKGVIIKK